MEESEETNRKTEEEPPDDPFKHPGEVKTVFKIPTIAPAGSAVKLSKTGQKDNGISNEVKETGSLESPKVHSGNEISIKPDSIQKEREKDNIPLPYKEPKWSGVPHKPYSLEVIKNGVIVGNIDLNGRAFTVCGRLTKCDVVMEHPSISRYHAVIQHRCVNDTDDKQPEGFYLFDLDSTHGTQLNKAPLKPRTFYRLHVGHMIKFGGSSRNYVLQGPTEDEEEESPMTVTEIKEKRIQDEMQKKAEEDGKARKLQEVEDAGIDWGMGDDAEEEEASDINPFAIDKKTENEDSYFDDPKKTLRGWFEREGYELEYKVEEVAQAQFVCRVHLPVDNASGQPIVAEAKVKGKKKEAVVACALEACRILDRQGVLRQSACKSKTVAKKNWEDNDYYDSDEDTFLDRTGTIERKRQQRIRNAGKGEDVVETHESLLEKHKNIVEEIAELETTLYETKKRENQASEETEDSLEAYMQSINNDKTLDKSIKTNLKLKIAQLKIDEKKIARLIKITKPADLPPLMQQPVIVPNVKKQSLTKQLKAPPTIKTAEPALEVDEHDEDCPTAQSAVEQKTERVLNENVDLSKDNQEIDTTSSVKEIDQAEDVPTKEPLPQTTEVEKRRQSQERKVSKRAKLKYEYDSSNPNYHMWVPPSDQSGDGKTKLNEKFGY